MSEPNESAAFDTDASEESEALGVARELMGDAWDGGDNEADVDDSAPAAAPARAQGQPAVQSPAQPSLTLDQAQQRWHQQTMTRSQMRQELDRQHAERLRYEEMANAILRAQQAQQPPQQPEYEQPQIDPDLQRYFDSRLEQMQQQFQQTLSPVLSLAQQQQQAQEIQQQVAQDQGQWNEFRGIVDRAEADYMATPEGQGYVERVTGFQGALTKTCERAGLAPEVAQRLVNEEIKGTTILAMSLGISPPLFLDAYAQSMLEWAQSRLGGNGQQGALRPNGNGQRPPQGRVSPQVQIARQATMNGAVGAPPHGSNGGSGGTVTVADLMGRSLTGKDIDALVKEHGSLDRAMRYLDKLGMELEQLEG